MSLDVHEVNEKASFTVISKTLGETIVPDAQIVFNNQINFTDFNGIAQLTAPTVEEDLIFSIVATKTGYTSDTDTIVVKNIPNSPPNTPTIYGETNGSKQTTYYYTIQTTDPDQDDVKYHIDWGDNTSIITGFNESGDEIIVSHTWNIKGTYTMKVKAIDEYGVESDWTTLIVTMPYVDNEPVFQIWERLFLRFPNTFLVLRQLLGY